jgi:hypothetical protein
MAAVVQVTSTYSQYAIATIPSFHARLFISNLLQGLDDGIGVLEGLGLAAEITGDGLHMG